MGNTIINSVVFLSGLTAASYCIAGESLTCPSTIRMASGLIEPTDVPAGYRPIISNSIERLTGYSIFDGPPERGAALIPSSFSEKSHRSKWVFEASIKYEVWISCDYAKGLIRLAKRVKNPVASCTSIVQKETPERPFGVSVVCA